jgi:SPP1 family phage portal protein
MAGIQKIKIPVKANELTIEKVEPYLPYILGVFNENKAKVDHFFDVLKNQHDILKKTRRYEDDSENNNQVVTPYLYEMVRFKTGYAFGNPKEYAQSEMAQTNGLKYINRYSKDSLERAKDKNVANSVYTAGNGYYFIEPKSADFDSESEAPYVIYDKTPDTCAKVYSSYNGEEELFDILVNSYEYKDGNYPKTKTIISIYLPAMYYEYESSTDTNSFQQVIEKTKPRAIYKMLPLVEKFANEERIGIVELGESLQNSIDRLHSDQLDNVDDLVNELLVFMNTVLGKDQDDEAEFLKNAKRNGVIVLNDKNPDIKADVKTITQKLDYNGIISIIETLKRDLFDSCGVPIPSSDTSNGTKAGAVEKGNGYDNAYNRILDDYNSFEQADREVLKRKLFIAKSFANSKVDDLYASEIEIKYNPNMSDNMLTKSQSYVNFVEHGVPPVLAIQWCRISNDAITPAKQIEEYKAKLEEEAQNQTATEELQQQLGINTGNGGNIQNG